MKLIETSFLNILYHFNILHLITENELQMVKSIFNLEFPFRTILKTAQSIHVHIKVEDIANLPHERIFALGSKVENQKEGYIKYIFPNGLNMIFSSIKISEEDRLPEFASLPKPRVDHIGIDIREENALNYYLYNEIPIIGIQLGWRHVQQGSVNNPVYCCHTQVAEKHWLYPPSNSVIKFPIEFAYGKLIINQASMGCDLRPIDPIKLPNLKQGPVKTCQLQSEENIIS